MAARLYEPGETVRGTVYRVVKHLATGGMGTVYDVEDTSVGKRYVLKTLHPDLFGRNDLARRMEAEARTLGRLQHPNIVEVVTAGTTQDEMRLPYYVMERLNGQNLRTILEKKGALDAAHAYRIAIDLLDALEHAHDNGVVHRDVKPENIFLHRNHHGQTTTKLLDFGIMRLLDGAERAETSGRFVGTLRYASPEQIRVEGLGPSTDLYSAGLVLYEMLGGHGPFDDVKDAGFAHLNIPAPPLSRFARVPPLAERVVMASLSKKQEERPKDAFTFAAELRRVLRGEEEEARPETKVNPLSVVAEPPPPAPRFAPDAPTRGMPLKPPPHVHAHPVTAPMIVPPVADTLVNVMPGTLASPGVAREALEATELARSHANANGNMIPNAPPPVRAPLPSGPPVIDRNAETRGFAYAQGPRGQGHGTAFDQEIVSPDVEAARALVNAAPNAGAMELRFPQQQASPQTSTSPIESELTPQSRASPRSSVVAILSGGGAALVVLVVLWALFFREHDSKTPTTTANIAALSAVPPAAAPSASQVVTQTAAAPDSAASSAPVVSFAPASAVTAPKGTGRGAPTHARPTSPPTGPTARPSPTPPPVPTDL